MKIDFELTKNDHERIAEIVIQKIADKSFMESIFKLSEESARDKFWFLFEEQHSKVEFCELLKNNIDNTILSVIKKENLLEKGINNILNSKDMKIVTAEALRYKAYKLEEQAREIDEGIN